MTITLGPHGEGYCRTCHFIEPLDGRGRLATHTRWQVKEYGHSSVDDRRVCKGGGKKPPRVTPWYSRIAMFRVTAVGECPTCHQEVGLERFAAQDPFIGRHRHDGVFCPGYGLRAA